ncbi:MAG: hypothetical protein ACK443_05740 [Methylococcaceae bacterium]|jgi:hypothetical protein
MFLYAQRTDNKAEKWELHKDIELPEILKSHRHMSVYLQNEQHREGLDYNKVKLLGDLQFDINANDLATGITWVNKLLDLLQEWELNLDYLKVYCSGSKGFHITIPQKVFDPSPKATAILNKYHGVMASVIAETAGITMDMNLYHNRHLLRIANSQRNDNRWKVPISIEEVRSLSAIEYLQLVQAPRQLAVSHMVPPSYFCEKLGALWSRAKEIVKDQQAARARYAEVADADLDVFSGTTLPMCMEWMRDGNCISANGGFNKQAMNIAAFVAHAAHVTPEAKDRLLEGFAKTVQSDSKPSFGAKMVELRTKIRAAEAGTLKFSCGSNRSVLSDNPCNGCPLKLSNDSAAEAETSIEARNDGYYAINGRGDGMRITTFLLERQHHMVTYEAGNQRFLGDVFTLRQQVSGVETAHTVLIPAEDWTSLSAFKRAVSSVVGAVVTATAEQTLSALHIYLNTTQQTEALMRVNQLGIHCINDSGAEERFWVEPNWSLDALGMAGNYSYAGNAGDTVQSMRGIQPADAKDEGAIDLLQKLFNSNRPEVVGPMLGWAAACHLKDHLYRAGFSEFPLLHIAGKPSSGKTQSAIVYGALTGATGEGPIPVDSSTPSPLRQALSQTTTVARIFDEFNRPSMAAHRYLQVLGFIKAAYCRQNVAVGIITRKAVGESTAGTLPMYATAPLIYMSRESTENEELLARSIVIRIKAEDHQVSNYGVNFQTIRRSMSEVKSGGNAMQRLTKMLISKALKTTCDDCKGWYEEIKHELPLDENARKVNNLFVVRLGLAFLKRTLADFPREIRDGIARLDETVIRCWAEEESQSAHQRSNWSTSETVMQTFATMAQIHAEDRAPGRILPGAHYIRDNMTLYINPHLIFLPYRMYINALGGIPEAQSVSSLIYLLQNTSYYLGTGAHPLDPTARGWIALDLGQLDDRGIYANSFAER